MTDEKVKRINELARKAKNGGLTPAEAEEQKQLRAEYIAAYREDLRSQLENTYIIGPDGVKRRLEKKPGSK